MDDAATTGTSGETLAPPFAAERFAEVELPPSAATFETPKELRLANLFQGAFGIFVGGDEAQPQRVVIEFAKAKQAHVLARKWHPTQEHETLADGRVRLTFTLRDLTELTTWVLGWGPHALVLEPAALADRVAHEAREAAARYASPMVAAPIQVTAEATPSAEVAA